MKKINYTVILVILLLSVSVASVFAEGPGRGEISGSTEGAITELTVRYNISQLMGEPTINGTYKWSSNKVKKLNYDTVVWLKISNRVNGSAYIRLDPSVPERGAWAFNVTGSPSWSKALVAFWDGNSATEYVDAKTAKQFWKNGFQVVDAELSIKYE